LVPAGRQKSSSLFLKNALRIRARVPYLLLFLGVFLMWLPSIFNGLMNDDYISVLLSPQRWHLWNIRDYFYPLDPNAPYLRPLPPLTLYIDQVIWGVKAIWGWHLTSVLLHALNVVLVAVIARPLGRVGSTVAALAFGLHPILTEPVGWISSRFDILVSLFLLLSVWLFARRYQRLSAAVFFLALLSKEMALTFPFLIVGWLLFQRRAVKESVWHWVALLVYLAYRFFALSGFGGRSDWSPDFMSLLWRPWCAFVYPVPLQMQGWPPPGHLPSPLFWGAVVVCTGVLIVLLRNARQVWPLVIALVLITVPAFPLFQLGPSFQYGRFLYLPAVVWGLIIGVAFRHYSRWLLALLVLYVLTLSLLSIPPRVQFQKVGTMGSLIVEETVEAVPRLESGTRLWMDGIPVQVHGWNIFGNNLEIALNVAYGYPYDCENPAIEVSDINWDRTIGKEIRLPRATDVILLWDGNNVNRLSLTEWVLHRVGASDNPESVWPPEIPVGTVDFGNIPLSLFQAAGFRWNESDGIRTWNWAIEPLVVLRLPLDIRSDGHLTLRWMSAVDNRVRVVVNDSMVGELSVPGGFQWHEGVVRVPSNAWRAEPTQLIRFEFANQAQGYFVAFDQMDILPAPPD